MSLISIATSVGAPLVRELLARKLGGANADLAGRVIEAVAERMGADPADMPALIEQDPGAVGDAIREVEAKANALVPIWLAEAEFARSALDAEQDEPLWMRAWRPGGMYLIGFLWLWNTVLLHTANAVWKIALPPVPFDSMIQLSALYFTLYMGGHTVKDVVAKWQKGGAQ